MQLFDTLYDQLILFDEYADANTKTLLGMNSALPLCVAIVLYLWYVLKGGPDWMKKRDAFNLNKIIYTYNIIQIILNGIIFVVGYDYFSNMESIKGCVIFKNGTEMDRIVITGYLYIALKLLDFLDTVFFVLRKKFNQITFLHVFHHTVMTLVSWIALRYFSSGLSPWVAFINSFVHVVMYAYYQAALVYKQAPWLQRCKKHITHLQLIQFSVITLISLNLMYDDACPLNGQLYFRVWTRIQVLFNFSMVYLFSSFYYKTYIRKKKTK